MLQPTIRLRDRFASPLSGCARAGRLPAALLGFALFAATLHAQAVFVTGLSTPPAGTYDRSLALHFTATFNAPIVVTGSPRLALQVGERIRHATWTPPLGPSAATTALTFMYHPEPFDRDEDGITVLAGIDLNGGAIQATDTSAARLLFSPPDTRAVLIALRPPPTPRVLGLASGHATTLQSTARGDSFVLWGTADGGSVVTIDLVEVGAIGSVIAAPNGGWSMRYPASLLSPGTHWLTATAENSDGLVSAPSEPLVLKVRTDGTNSTLP